MRHSLTRLAIAFMACGLVASQPLIADDDAPTTLADSVNAETSDANVGQRLLVTQVEITGLPVVRKPSKADRPNAVVRVAAVYPRTNGGIYDFECYGLAPGKHDLRDYLQYTDGSPLTDAEPIMVAVASLLPEGQILPQALTTDRPLRMGGYRTWMVAVGCLWLAGLCLILFARRHREPPALESDRPLTLTELLAPKLDAARNGDLPSADYAELERMIVEHWRQQTRNSDIGYEEARAQLRDHPQAGPMIADIESWMHRPTGSRDGSLADVVARHDRALQTAGGPT